MSPAPERATPALNINAVITYYQQIGQHLLDAMQNLSALHLQLGRDLLTELADNHARWMASTDGPSAGAVLLRQCTLPLEPLHHYHQQLLDLLSMTQSNLMQTTHEHLNTLENTLTQASRTASASAGRPLDPPSARVHTGSAMHH